ncbi:MmpS family transport accessory protein [Mycobacterium ulcerans]|uniref:MmpS family transport accessory protein n=1 Tax=Mycobacterium ulcerans TaxID=1809 RepID=UPI000BBA964C|nr:MmpS family transport accessory protein [Mycobacterium ulcerans]
MLLRRRRISSRLVDAFEAPHIGLSARTSRSRLADWFITIGSNLARHAIAALKRHRRVDTIGPISNSAHTQYDTVRDVEDYPDDESYGGYSDYGYQDSQDDQDEYPDSYADLAWPADRRWRPVAAVLGVVVALGAITTALVINSGDSATTKGKVGVPTPRTVISTTPRTTAPSAPPRTAPYPSTSTRPGPGTSASQLPPKTFTTVTPPGAAPTWPPTAVAPLPGMQPLPAEPPSAALNPRTVIYRVTGTKQLLDMVNIVYTDARGFPVTEFNVALPWTKMVVLNPGVQTESVVATSIYGRLNCAIVNAQGQLVVASTNTSIIATCTR